MWDLDSESGTKMSALLNEWREGLELGQGGVKMWRRAPGRGSAYSNAKFISALRDAFSVSDDEQPPLFDLWQLAFADVVMTRLVKPVNHNAIGFSGTAAKPGEERTLPAVQAACEELTSELQSMSPPELVVRDWLAPVPDDEA